MSEPIFKFAQGAQVKDRLSGRIGTVFARTDYAFSPHREYHVFFKGGAADAAAWLAEGQLRALTNQPPENPAEGSHP